MTETNEFDIEKAFAESFKDVASDNTEQRNCFGYSSFNACRNQGTIYGKVIPSISRGKLSIYKTLNNVWIGSIPFKKDDGSGDYYRSVRVVPASEYNCELTQEQLDINSSLIKEIERYNELMVNKGGAQWEPFRNKRVSFFYMMIRRYTDLAGEKNDYTDPNVTCVYHQSFRFGEKFNEAVNKRTEAKESPAWLKDFFNRTNGLNTNFTCITTKRPDVAYEITFAFEELPALKFVAKEDDLKTAESLDEAFVNTLVYDTDFYKEVLNRIKELNDNLDKDPKLVDEVPVDRTNHNVE